MKYSNPNPVANLKPSLSSTKYYLENFPHFSPLISISIIIAPSSRLDGSLPCSRLMRPQARAPSYTPHVSDQHPMHPTCRVISHVQSYEEGYPQP